MSKPPEPTPSKPVALVTGGATRVGAVLCRRLAGEGFAVVIHYRGSAEKAEALRDDIIESGAEAAVVQADLTDRPARKDLIAKAQKPFGPLTLLVNNASAFEPDSIDDLDEALWDMHFAVHAEAPIFLARDFAAQIPPGTDANIVNIIDERVLHPTPAYFSYTLSKAVLHTATVTLAQSLAPHIRVNAIGPGPTLPHSGQTDAQFDASVRSLPLQRNADPDALADGLIFLLSAKAMTGQMLALDGGRHLQHLPQRGKTPRK